MVTHHAPGALGALAEQPFGFGAQLAQGRVAPPVLGGRPALEAGRTVAIETDEGSWLSLDVSPDGETIVFDLLGDLYTLPIAGGDATPLTEGMAYDSQPRYRPDGATVLFVSDRDGAENLWLIDVETEKTTQITKGKTSSYESPEWLPDSRYVVAAKANHALVGGAGRNPKLWMWHVDGGSGIQLIKEPDQLRTTGPAPTPTIAILEAPSHHASESRASRFRNNSC